LFANEAVKNVMVCERLQGNDAVRSWSWNWLKQLSNFEARQLEALKELLFDFSFSPNCIDRWRWKSDSLGLFTVRSCYSLLNELREAVALDNNVLVAIKKLWSIDFPSKIHVFG
jgi:hypothetical protein